jgi:crotonobetainyl-CoA:carnitine CoA-transferase CaiB-like acyl-CoA transferase
MVDIVQPGQTPISAPSACGDSTTGAFLFGGVCAALLNRERTGKGEKVVVSLYGASIWVTSCIITAAQERYGKVYPIDRYLGNPNATPYKTKDGEWIMLTILDFDRDGHKMFEFVGRPDFCAVYPNRAAFISTPDRSEVVKAYEKFFAEHDCAWLVAELKKRDFVGDRMGHFKEVTADPQAWANNYLEKVEYKTPGNEGFGAIPNSPIELTETTKVPFKRSPLLGEHTTELLKSVGYSDDAVKAMLESKAAVQKQK